MHKDHLGSIVGISNSSGAAVVKYWYDAWGYRIGLLGTTKTLNNTYVNNYSHHGFTAHEQLDDFGLIHMNGRIYDPILGRFQTPDPNVFYPESTQGFNRYSYTDNNPLSYTDPSGYGWFSDFVDSVKYEWNNSPVFRVVVVVAAGAVLGAGAFALLNSGVVGTVGVGALTFAKGVTLGSAMLLGGAALGVPQIVRELGGSAPDNPAPGSGATIGGGGSSGGSGSSGSVAGGGVSDAMADAGQELRAKWELDEAEFGRSVPLMLASNSHADTALDFGTGGASDRVLLSRAISGLKFVMGRAGILSLAVPTEMGDGELHHRGRLQAQGGGTEKSVSWTLDAPLTVYQGLALLDRLRGLLTKPELRVREEAFLKAERFMRNAAKGGGVGFTKQSMLVRGTKDIRVDIEVQEGFAFTP